MKLNHKTLMLGGAAVGLLILFLYIRSRQSQGAAQSGQPGDTTGTAQDQAASDYATLAGMFQQLQAQEQGDIATLEGQLQNWQAATVKGHFKQLFPGAFALMRQLEKELAAAMAGQRREAAELAKLRKELAKLRSGKDHGGPKWAHQHVTHNGHAQKVGIYPGHGERTRQHQHHHHGRVNY